MPNDDNDIALAEAKWQSQNGNGNPLTQDLARLGISGLRVSDFKSDGTLPYQTGSFVHGNITFVLSPNGTSATALTNIYNFDVKYPWWSNAIRNILTAIGKIHNNGPGTPFEIHFIGSVGVSR